MAKHQQDSCGFGGAGISGGSSGLHKGALVARETRCELSFCAMPLPSILKKASSYILGESCQDSLRAMYQDGETLFCKNNVCVHPPTLLRQQCDVVHHPGYMTVTCKLDKPTGTPTLHLSWIPNSTLRKHPSTLEKSRRLGTAKENEPQLEEPGKRKIPDKLDGCLEAKEPVNCRDCERVCSGGTKAPPPIACQPAASNGDASPKELSIERNGGVGSIAKEPTSDCARRSQPTSIQFIRSDSTDSRSEEVNGVKDRVKDGDDISVKSRSMSLTSTCSLSIVITNDEEIPTWMRTPELLALQHNLAFPESATASPVAVRRAHRCRRFSVDLGQMRSLRLFFADPECTSGQLVVASRESQYKILHFHHGGLDRLAATLHQWHQLLNPNLNVDTEESLPYRHFMVCRPEVTRDELHPEEGQVPMITSLAWKDLLNERGQVEDDLALRKGIFFGGLEPALRKLVWPFLLHCYSYQSTYDDREQIDAIRRQEYEEIKRRRETMNPEEADKFWRNVVCIVEKDVVRTDRGNPYYAGEDNPNIEVMKNILLNYAVYNACLGYTQGMSDLLSPLLAELNDEQEAFWCFAGLMQRSVAVCTPTDVDMDRNLCYLRELLRIMVPSFYAHLEKHADALELLFCHRWILLCLKREFPMDVALTMWEACWVNYLTDHFHLFLCLAIMCVYADDVVAQDLRTDEMLLHFSSLAMYMDGTVILRKARGLLHHFRLLDRLPCTLAGLCKQCGPGMWDSSHDPVIECVGHEDEKCPHAENYSRNAME
ncbi:TBC1 domain family member 16 isoform X1 [Nasonia vitripennis]|uniref:Rab-GAP TBC domain-containing protein n=1 Tax=Nasonia vitripennis TaxID=7425 RepID=A0A7M7QSQ4_NASVI|nr:TBC1 domain family member 16 isoform X1 [Nasonia vitripennis]XP_032454017.1 TBC1 domain family member 16 isoform X1 [Nasonia vitripennis]